MFLLLEHPPMMTHVYKKANETIAAAKGGIERIMAVCHLFNEDQDRVAERANQMASKGYRVLGVASGIVDTNELPVSQDEFNWHFVGLISLYDPPKGGGFLNLIIFL
jgi:P-type Ca2+ transporter type 2C